LSDRATTTGRLLGPKVRNSIKCLSQGHRDALSHRKSSEGFATFRLLGRRLYQLTKDMQAEQLQCWSGMTDTEHSKTSGLKETSNCKLRNW